MCLNQIYWLREINQLQFSLCSDCRYDRECYDHDCDDEDISYCYHGSCKCTSSYISTSTIYETYLREWKSKKQTNTLLLQADAPPISIVTLTTACMEKHNTVIVDGVTAEVYTHDKCFHESWYSSKPCAR